MTIDSVRYCINGHYCSTTIVTVDTITHATELDCLLLVHLFACFVRVNFCHFSRPLGVGVGRSL